MLAITDPMKRMTAAISRDRGEDSKTPIRRLVCMRASSGSPSVSTRPAAARGRCHTKRWRWQRDSSACRTAMGPSKQTWPFSKM